VFEQTLYKCLLVDAFELRGHLLTQCEAMPWQCAAVALHVSLWTAKENLDTPVFQSYSIVSPYCHWQFIVGIPAYIVVCLLDNDFVLLLL
jgi:hypothetical protein